MNDLKFAEMARLINELLNDDDSKGHNGVVMLFFERYSGVDPRMMTNAPVDVAITALKGLLAGMEAGLSVKGHA